MKIITVSAIALTAVGFASVAQAQQLAQPAGKLFFEGDIVRHALPNQAGPFCVLVNQYKRGEAVAFRIRTLLPNGEIADDKVIKSLVVELGNGQRLPASYKPHGSPPTDYFWSFFWAIPADHPTGSIGYKVIATMNDGSTVEWKPRASLSSAIGPTRSRLSTATCAIPRLRCRNGHKGVRNFPEHLHILSRGARGRITGRASGSR